MKILTNKKYNKLIARLSDLERTDKYLREELDKAENLKSILEKITDKTISPITISGTGLSWASGGLLSLEENVLIEVDDILGGKVVKQYGSKCLVVDKHGNVKTGLTKQK